jgi:hypothetical protein
MSTSLPGVIYCDVSTCHRPARVFVRLDSFEDGPEYPSCSFHPELDRWVTVTREVGKWERPLRSAMTIREQESVVLDLVRQYDGLEPAPAPPRGVNLCEVARCQEVATVFVQLLSGSSPIRSYCSGHDCCVVQSDGSVTWGRSSVFRAVPQAVHSVLYVAAGVA